jgi:homoserine dehydrogenase
VAEPASLSSADSIPLPAIGVGLLGLGIVGAGVYEALETRAASYARRAGRSLDVRRVAVRDLDRARPVELDAAMLTTDPFAVATADDIEIVVELMGGETPAVACIRAALEAGKHVVTANKEVMAKHGPELLALAQSQSVELLYEASVGGGIPIISPLKRDLQANEVQRIQAIINGTTNFMLTAMAAQGASYADILAEAQRRGYAEADPTSDVEGHDAAYKLAILASLGFHTTVSPDDVFREGITELTARDFKYATDLGYVIRLVATAQRVDAAEDTLDVRVHPCLIPKSEPLARVDGVLNAVAVEGDLVGRAIFEGEGAGTAPTTSAVVADVLDIAYGIAAGQTPRPLRPSDPAPCIQPIGELRIRYYLRMVVHDQPGVLADLGRLLAQNHTSIASLLQVEADAVAGTAELVMTTHETRESDLEMFRAAAAQMDSVRDIGIRIRMESARS